MSQEPEKESSRLMSDAIALYWLIANGKGDGLEFHRLKRRIDTLLARVPGEPGGLSARAILLAARDDIEAVKIFERVVAIIPYAPEARLNYINVLNHFGFADRALSQAKAAWDLSEGNPEILDRLIRYSSIQGYLEDAKQWLAQWNKEHPGESFKDIADIELLERVAHCHPSADLSAMADMLAIATQVARDFGTAPRVSGFTLHEDEESAWLSIPIAVNADTDTIVDMELELSDRLAYTDVPLQLKDAAVAWFVAREMMEPITPDEAA